MLKIKTLVVGILATACIATAARSATLGVDLIGSNWNTSSYYINSGSTLGYEFHLSGSATVSGLGFWDFDGTYPTVDVGLWNATTHALIGSVSIAPTDPVTTIATAIHYGAWHFVSFNAVLGAGDYAGAVLEYAKPFTGAAIQENVLSYSFGRYYGICCGTSLQFPVSTNTLTNSYFGGNVLIEAGGVTPLPATLPLFASGLGGLGLLGWRRKRKKAARTAA